MNRKITPSVAASVSTIHQPSYDAGYAQGAFDEAQGGAVAVPVSEEQVQAAHDIIWPEADWEGNEHACRETVRAALTAALAVPQDHVRPVLQRLHEGYQVNHSSKWVHRVVSEALAVPDKGVQGDQGALIEVAKIARLHLGNFPDHGAADGTAIYNVKLNGSQLSALAALAPASTVRGE